MQTTTWTSQEGSKCPTENRPGFGSSWEDFSVGPGDRVPTTYWGWVQMKPWTIGQCLELICGRCCPQFQKYQGINLTMLIIITMSIELMARNTVLWDSNRVMFQSLLSLEDPNLCSEGPRGKDCSSVWSCISVRLARFWIFSRTLMSFFFDLFAFHMCLTTQMNSLKQILVMESLWMVLIIIS